MFPHILTLPSPAYGESNLRAVFARINPTEATSDLTVRDRGASQFLLPISCDVSEETK
jgi:hypothetical protein